MPIFVCLPSLETLQLRNPGFICHCVLHVFSLKLPCFFYAAPDGSANIICDHLYGIVGHLK